jgi:hypothetical protein
MVKKIITLSLICAAFSIWAAVNKAQEVDAVSTATVHINIKFVTPLQVAGDSAIIKWTDTRNRSKNGKVILTYEPSSGTKQTRAVTNQEAKALLFSLIGLTPKTTYKIRLEVTDTVPGNTHKVCADTATITTLTATSAKVDFNTQKKVPLELLDHSVRLGSAAKSNDRLVIADCQGRTVLDHHVNGAETAINLPSKAKGIYFLTYSREGKILDQKQFVIIHK